MRLFYHKNSLVGLLVLCVLLVLGACKLDDNRVKGQVGPGESITPIPTPTPDNPSPTYGSEPQEEFVPWLKLSSFQFNLPEGTSNQSSQIVEVSNIHPTRPYTFYLKDTNGAVSGLSCAPSPNAVVSNSSIHVDFGLQLTGGTLDLSCSANNVGSFTARFNYLASPIINITSSIRVSPLGGAVYFVDFDISEDQKWLAFEVSGATNNSYSQIFAKNRLTGEVFLVSSYDGVATGNGSSTTPKITADGRYVFFTSQATNLATGAAGMLIYRKDLYFLNQPPLVVSSLDSTQEDQTSYRGGSSFPDITPDGRFVVFESSSSNFLMGASGGQIFLKDLASPGKAPLLVSSLDSTKADQSSYAGNSRHERPKISADGRYVTFATDSTNFATGAANEQIYRKDMNNPHLPPVIVSSTDSTQSDQSSYQSDAAGFMRTRWPDISSDGRYIVFATYARNFVTGVPVNRLHIYRKDMDNLSQPPIIVSSHDSTLSDQTSAQGNSYSLHPSISDDGRYVLFSSEADNFITGFAWTELFIKDMDQPSVSPTIVSSTDSTQADQTNFASDNINTTMFAKISPDNRYVTFVSNSEVLVPDGGTGKQIFVKDLNQLAVAPTKEGTLNSTSSEQVTPYLLSNSEDAKASADGRYVVFQTTDSSILGPFPSDSNQIYVKDLQNPTSLPVAVSSADSTQSDQSVVGGNASSLYPVVSADGRYVAFRSQATNFVTGASGYQIYRKDLGAPGQPPILVSSNDSTQADQTSYKGNNTSLGGPDMSADGRWVVFSSKSSNFVTGAGGSDDQVYRKDLTSPASPPLIVSSLDSAQADQTSFKGNTNGGGTSPKVSDDGRYIYFVSNSTNFVTNSNGLDQVYRKDMNNLSVPPVIVSSVDSTQADQATYQGDNRTVLKDISPDGRWAVLYSRASNFVTGGGGTYYQLYRKDMDNPHLPPVIVSSLDSTQSDQTSYKGSNSAQVASITADGRYIYFESNSMNFPYGNFSGNVYFKDMNNLASPPQLVGSADKDQADQTNYRLNSGDPYIAPDRSFLIFSAYSSGKVPGVGGQKQIFFYKY